MTEIITKDLRFIPVRYQRGEDDSMPWQKEEDGSVSCSVAKACFDDTLNIVLVTVREKESDKIRVVLKAEELDTFGKSTYKGGCKFASLDVCRDCDIPEYYLITMFQRNVFSKALLTALNKLLAEIFPFNERRCRYNQAVLVDENGAFLVIPPKTNQNHNQYKATKKKYKPKKKSKKKHK